VLEPNTPAFVQASNNAVWPQKLRVLIECSRPVVRSNYPPSYRGGAGPSSSQREALRVNSRDEILEVPLDRWPALCSSSTIWLPVACESRSRSQCDRRAGLSSLELGSVVLRGLPLFPYGAVAGAPTCELFSISLLSRLGAWVRGNMGP